MNKDEKLQLIWNYIFGSGGKAEWKEKFEIAWDVWQTFDDIKKEIRKKVIEFLYEQLKRNSEFKNYENKDFGLREGKKWRSLIFYKPEWFLNLTEPVIIGYAIEADQYDYYNLYYGIVEYHPNNEGDPSRGGWGKPNIPEEWKKIVEQMRESLAMPLRSGGRWILWRNFDEPYHGMRQREFYEEILDKSDSSIEDGCREVAKYYVENLINLKRKTENLVDELIEVYRISV